MAAKTGTKLLHSHPVYKTMLMEQMDVNNLSKLRAERREPATVLSLVPIPPLQAAAVTLRDCIYI